MTVILFNPKANNRVGEARAREWVLSHGEDPENMRNVLDIEDLGAFVGSLGEEDKLILIGGDGTLTRFADAIRNVTLRVPVYYVPGGTGNDFYYDIKDGKPEEPVLINKYITNLPIVRVNGEEHVFVNGIGYGLDGYCCEVGDELQRKSDKPVNYASIAIKGLMGKYHVCNATVTVDGETRSYRKVWLAPTMNGRYYGGGLMITPGQDRLNEDGTVSVAVVHSSGRLHTLLMFPKIGKGKHVGLTKMVDIRRGHEVTVRFDRPCALQIDGETVLGVTEYSVLSRHAAHPVEETAATAPATAEV